MKILIRQMTQATGISPVIESFFMFSSCTWPTGTKIYSED